MLVIVGLVTLLECRKGARQGDLLRDESKQKKRLSPSLPLSLGICNHYVLVFMLHLLSNSRNSLEAVTPARAADFINLF
jgi:hypothetical protein